MTDPTRIDVRSENHQLQARLRNVVSLDKMKQALEQKDLDLAEAQKTAREKAELADMKLASVSKLEEEHAKLKTAVDEAKKEAAQLKEEKVALADKVDVLTRKRDELEAYLGGLAKKLFLMLEGILPRPTGSKTSSQRCRQLTTFLFVQSSVRISRRKLGGSREDWTPPILPSRMKLP